MWPEGAQNITKVTKRPQTAGTLFKNSMIELSKKLVSKVSSSSSTRVSYCVCVFALCQRWCTKYGGGGSVGLLAVCVNATVITRARVSFLLISRERPSIELMHFDTSRVQFVTVSVITDAVLARRTTGGNHRVIVHSNGGGGLFLCCFFSRVLERETLISYCSMEQPWLRVRAMCSN